MPLPTPRLTSAAVPHRARTPRLGGCRSPTRRDGTRGSASCTSWGRSPGTARRSTAGAPTPCWRPWSTPHGRTVGEHALVDEVWGPDQPPANPAKALQVVVSRTRVADRTRGGRARGGRLPPRARRRRRSTRSRCATTSRRRPQPRAAATGWPPATSRGGRWPARAPASGGDGPLAALRDDARRLRAEAAAVLGRSLSALGDHREALPLLEEAGVGDEETAAALLRSPGRRARQPRGARPLRAGAPRPRRPARRRPRTDPGRRARRAARRRQPGALRAAPRVDLPGRSRRRHPGAARRWSASRGSSRSSAPAGLGKTRLAHLLGQEAEQPVVHFVELVGVASPDDVVGEVGSALGVRDSVSGRRVLTPEQRNDVRARTAQSLAGAPALLILDNCEHVVEAVADLVAFLVASCPRLRVVTTTRAPAGDRRRAGLPARPARRRRGIRAVRPARPGRAARRWPSTPQTVLSVVRRLDGLPLAIELAAARVRAMSVEDIDRRLDDRFALLRGGDRTAPDRHQTLLAVIDWSWNLLHETERRALRWLSTFHDGFSLDGADAVLGHDALDDVRSLVDQSLLTVLDSGRTVRYRMLETVREFGRLQLVEAGRGRGRARRPARPGPATSRSRVGDDLWSPRQVEAVREVAVEENNLADALREALALPDPWSVVRLLTGARRVLDHPRREPPGHRRRGRVRRRAGRLGADGRAGRRGRVGRRDRSRSTPSAARSAGSPPASPCSTTSATAPRRPGCAAWSPWSRRRCWATRRARSPGSSRSRRSPTGRPPAVARLWAAHHLENSGDPTGAIDAGRPGPGPGQRRRRPVDRGDAAHHGRRPCSPSSGDSEEAVRHARAALPVLDRLDAADDASQTRALLAVHAMSVGRLDEAEEWMAEIERTRRRSSDFGGASLAGGPRRDGPGPRSGRRGPGALPGRRRRARGDQVPGHGRRHRAGAVGAVRREPGRHRPRRARHAPPDDLADGRALLPRAPGQVAARCSTRTGPSWTTPWPGWCCTGSAPGGCCATRCRPTPPCGCSCSPSGSATPGSRPRCGPSAPRRPPRSGRPGWPRGCAPTTPDAPPRACCPRPGPRSTAPGAAAAG